MFSATHAFITRLDADKLKATPHVVPQPGLLRSAMGDDAFLAALDERRRWIAKHCVGEFQIADLQDEIGEKIGKSYRFSDRDVAFLFRFLF